jgi:RNA polymerase sigma factor (sigma-70 family)
VPTIEDAEDAAQNAFLRAAERGWLSTGEESPIRSLGAWLYTVAMTDVAANARKVSNRRRLIAERAATIRQPYVPNPFLEVLETERVEVVRAAISRLPYQQRWIIQTWMEGRSLASIAEWSGLSQSKVQSRFAKALQILVRQLRGLR